MKDNPLFIGIDLGTQSTKTVIVNKNGEVLSEVNVPSNLVIESDGKAYEDADAIFNNALKSIQDAIKQANINGKDIVSIGIGAQMAGIMAIDKNFNAVGPLDSWLDVRAEKYTEQIKEKFGDRVIDSSGGQIMHSHASKILWRKYEKPAEYAQITKFIEPNGYVSGKLVGLSSDDAFIDSTFIHFNCFSDNRNLSFNKEFLDAFDIEESKMPRVVSSSEVIGVVNEKYASLLGLSNDVKVIAGCGDTAASSLGAGITSKGLAYDVAGTASVFACATDVFTPDTKNHTMLFSRSVIDGLYLALAYVVGGGLCIRWFSTITKTSYDELTRLAKEVDDKDMEGLFFVPHFSGRAFPLDSGISGAFFGLSASTRKGEMFKAILESIAFEYNSYLIALQSLGCIDQIDNIYGVGGGVKNDLFCQIKADVLGSKYSALIKCDSAPVASALFSGKVTGFIDTSLEELFKKPEKDMIIYQPNEEKHQYYAKKYMKYQKIVNNYSKYLK